MSRLALALFLVGFQITVAAAESDRLAIENRKAACTSLADYFVSAYEEFASGKDFNRFRKELEIEVAGEDFNEDLMGIVLVGARIAARYLELKRDADQLRVDFLHPCVTSQKAPAEVLADLWKATMPSEPRSASDFSFQGDGSLRPQDYRYVLNEVEEGLQTISTDVRREAGRIHGCGIQFSHIDFDDIYSLGAPVKLTGSINLMRHPQSALAGYMKVKGEDMRLFLNPDGTPELRTEVFPIVGLYLTYGETPLLADSQTLDCEDPDFTCQANFDWEPFSKAMLENSAGIGYRRNDGSSDVNLLFDWSQPESSNEEVERFHNCTLQLLANTMEDMEATED